MKYLKRFESLFGPAEPERISFDDFYQVDSPSSSFTEKELLYLESIFDANHEKISDVEYVKGAHFIYNKFTSGKTEFPDNFIVFIYSNKQNGELIGFDCYKHAGDWYYVWISQGSDGPFEPGFKEAWKCDEFDSLKKLLDKWL